MCRYRDARIIESPFRSIRACSFYDSVVELLCLFISDSFDLETCECVENLSDYNPTTMKFTFLSFRLF